MKERPILFSASMVRALLDGSKTQTRRVMKNPPTTSEHFPWLGVKSLRGPGHFVYPNALRQILAECPYGQSGDRLWVREKFQPLYAEGYEFRSVDWDTGKGYAISYPATDGIHEYIDPDDNITSACKPSIHMPRWASRILLEIVSVRMERLQDISEVDALAEGMSGCTLGQVGRVDRYRHLWETINGPGSWDVNPWVWVVEFKIVESE
ncbi:hypothetical protein [Aquitalea aquatilis]|uniref:hypothetical protein n=1 Tax=Aquitalea aquatilis TaxID=1537400 RepID=UPI0010BDE63B|nr:hypothetical protein [Aquitalea aquatilis]